jgi:predicted dehydrogenase
MCPRSQRSTISNWCGRDDADGQRVVADHYGAAHAFDDVEALAALPDPDLVVVSVKAPARR